jgi:diguanylate cyclase (GGDEF)-like protein/PAS domain S-box-containing protein
LGVVTREQPATSSARKSSWLPGQSRLRSRNLRAAISLIILGLAALTIVQLERAARSHEPSVVAAFGRELSGVVVAAVILAGVAVLVRQRRMQRRELGAPEKTENPQSTINRLQLRAALDAIPDPVWLKSVDGRFSICNSQFERCVGASEADLIGRTDYDLVDRRLADFFRENDRKVLAAGEPRANEEWLTFATTGYRGLFETIKAPMRGPDGELIGVLGIARDITTRYRAERAAKLSKARLSVALHATQIAIWDWDIKRDRWYASRVYYTSLGYPPERRRGDREIWIERVHPDDRGRVLGIIQKAMQGDTAPYEYEARLRHADGSYRWMQVRGVAVDHNSRGLATRMLGVRQDITEKKAAEERIRRLAHYDTLTQLPNRTWLNEIMPGTFTRARIGGETMAVLVVDVDNFKNINDTFGHSIGDELLVDVAKRIGTLACEADVVARIGGDTFVMVLSGGKISQAITLAQRLIELLSLPFRTGQLDLMITASIGVALSPAHGVDFDTLFKCADGAMHRAKQQGRNHYVVFSEEMHLRSARNLILETELRHAIDRGELLLHYQPQVSLTDGRLTGVEALLRWHNPNLGTVSPAEFIPITEDSGQILKIGSWVLRQAVSQLRDWLAQGLPPLSLAVNLSCVQFRDPQLPELIRRVMDEAGLHPRFLELELTERVALDDPGGAVAVMNELHELGVRIAIDDFGTGYSSLSYLKRFRASQLKIDQSFVRGVADDAEDQAIVKAIIGLAGSLGVGTIAEGVETAEQLEFLKKHGCQQAQGFYFSPAIGGEQFATFARQWL